MLIDHIPAPDAYVVTVTVPYTAYLANSGSAAPNVIVAAPSSSDNKDPIRGYTILHKDETPTAVAVSTAPVKSAPAATKKSKPVAIKVKTTIKTTYTQVTAAPKPVALASGFRAAMQQYDRHTNLNRLPANYFVSYGSNTRDGKAVVLKRTDYLDNYNAYIATKSGNTVRLQDAQTGEIVAGEKALGAREFQELQQDWKKNARASSASSNVETNLLNVTVYNAARNYKANSSLTNPLVETRATELKIPDVEQPAKPMRTTAVVMDFVLTDKVSSSGLRIAVPKVEEAPQESIRKEQPNQFDMESLIALALATISGIVVSWMFGAGSALLIAQNPKNKAFRAKVRRFMKKTFKGTRVERAKRYMAKRRAKQDQAKYKKISVAMENLSFDDKKQLLKKIHGKQTYDLALNTIRLIEQEHEEAGTPHPLGVEMPIAAIEKMTADIIKTPKHFHIACRHINLAGKKTYWSPRNNFRANRNQLHNLKRSDPTPVRPPRDILQPDEPIAA